MRRDLKAKAFVVLLMVASASVGWLVGHSSRRVDEGEALLYSEAMAERLRETEMALDKCELGRK